MLGGMMLSSSSSFSSSSKERGTKRIKELPSLDGWNEKRSISRRSRFLVLLPLPLQTVVKEKRETYCQAVT